MENGTFTVALALWPGNKDEHCPLVSGTSSIYTRGEQLP